MVRIIVGSGQAYTYTKETRGRFRKPGPKNVGAKMRAEEDPGTQLEHLKKLADGWMSHNVAFRKRPIQLQQ